MKTNIFEIGKNHGGGADKSPDDAAKKFNVELINQDWHHRELRHRHLEKFYWISSVILSIGVVMAAGMSAYFARSAWEDSHRAVIEARQTTREVQRQTAVAETQLRLAYPAKLKLTNLQIFEGTDPRNEVTSFEPGIAIHGQAFFTNLGREEPIIKETRCLPYWHIGNLPMNRPHLDPSFKCDWSWVKDENGQTKTNEVRVDFSTTVRDDYTPDMDFYFLGFIQYEDEISRNLVTRFARRFDPGKGRFVPVDNPDYEDER